MSFFFFTMASVMGEFLAGAFFITLVVAVLLALGGVIMAAYLLWPPVRKNLDRQMARREGDIWTDTLAFVDAQKELYRRQHRKDSLGWTNDDAMCEAVIKPGEPARFTNLTPMQQIQERVKQ